jgi:hypothetical protein
MAHIKDGSVSNWALCPVVALGPFAASTSRNVANSSHVGGYLKQEDFKDAASTVFVSNRLISFVEQVRFREVAMCYSSMGAIKRQRVCLFKERNKAGVDVGEAMRGKRREGCPRNRHGSVVCQLRVRRCMQAEHSGSYKRTGRIPLKQDQTNTNADVGSE